MAMFDVVVPDGDVPLAVRVHHPDGDLTRARPAVVTMGSWLTVKEQMADLYAARLADRGFVAVSFDFTGFGASGGSLRQTEIPMRKVVNIATVVGWLSSLSFVAPPVGVVAVCASAQYTLAAIARGLPIGSFASVAGWFHDTASVAPFYGGPDGVADRLARGSAATERYVRTGEPSLVPAYAAGDDRAGMFLEMDYYANPSRGAPPQWRNEMTEMTWQHWLTFDGLRAAAANTVPTLFVHSEGCVFPDNVRAVADRATGPAEIRWGDGEQTDYYDQRAQLEFAVDATTVHLRRTLAP